MESSPGGDTTQYTGKRDILTELNNRNIFNEGDTFSRNRQGTRGREYDYLARTSPSNIRNVLFRRAMSLGISNKGTAWLNERTMKRGMNQGEVPVAQQLLRGGGDALAAGDSLTSTDLLAAGDSLTSTDLLAAGDSVAGTDLLAAGDSVAGTALPPPPPPFAEALVPITMDYALGNLRSKPLGGTRNEKINAMLNFIIDPEVTDQSAFSQCPETKKGNLFILMIVNQLYSGLRYGDDKIEYVKQWYPSAGEDAPFSFNDIYTHFEELVTDLMINENDIGCDPNMYNEELNALDTICKDLEKRVTMITRRLTKFTNLSKCANNRNK